MYRPILFLLIVLFVSVCPVHAQECTPPTITANARAYNIFTPEQETILGDLTYQRMTRELRLVRDPQLNAYLNNLGQKLTKHLPPIGIKFQFHIIDLPDANAFNIPGGYVFVSRKLIGFSRDEDELAGVLAHELGHAVVRHGAIDFSQLLKKVLNVTSLGDRKDVIEKYNLVLERHRTKNISRDSGHENEQQLEADRIGLYAMVAAGYDPSAFADFFGRLVESKGKSGNWFSDVFGKTKPEEKRLREMAKASEKLPAQCRENRGQREASQGFLTWQADVVSYRETGRAEELPALLWKKELTPKLRTDLSHFAFSSDGKYFLAQDDFSITIVRRDPAEVVFQIPAPQARDASFTPDGQFVVFGTQTLRYEKWSIAERKPVAVRELVLRRDCWEHEFSPDGNYLACVDYGMNLNVLDTQSGKKIWEKKDFYKLTFFEFITWILRDDDRADRLFHIVFSPDSKHVVVSRSNKARFVFKVDMEKIAGSEDTVLALDLGTLKPVDLGGDMKKVTRRPFAFLDPTRIVGMISTKTEESGIFSFPSGKRLAKFPLGGDELKSTANPNYVIVKPIAGAKLGVLDVGRQKIIAGINKDDVAIWNDSVVFESVSGKVLLSEVAYSDDKKMLERKDVKILDIPVGLVGALHAGEVSDNFKWLAISSKSRGAIWELNSGEQKIFVRGFRGALVVNDGNAIADFPELEPTNHSLVIMNPNTKEAQVHREIPQKGAKQYGGFVLIRKSLSQAKKEDNKKAGVESAEETEDDVSLTREVRFELRHVVTDKLIWSRDFPKDAPDYFFDDFSGRIILYWTLGSDVGKAGLKENPALAARAKEMGNKDDDYLLEIVDAFAGKTIGSVLVETGKGSFRIKSGFSEGDWLVMQDSDNRVLVYSIKDGNLNHRFFGAEAAVNPVRKQIVVENYPGELTLYDLASGEPQGRLVLNRDTVLTRFSLDGKRLFVLTAEQVAYAFDLDKMVVPSSSATTTNRPAQ
jgi:WD40 repeat protein